MNIEEYKKHIQETLRGAAFGSVTEKLDPHVDELAGSLIAAGPQKTADAVGKMDPATFTEFCKKIDAQGILMITKQFAASGAAAPVATPGAPQQGTPAVTSATPAPAAPAAPPAANQQLKDL